MILIKIEKFLTTIIPRNLTFHSNAILKNITHWKNESKKHPLQSKSKQHPLFKGKFLLESDSSYYLSEILKISNIKEVKAPPKAINALSASETSTGKKRLIADLSISMNIIQ